jgi:hypothetical protein
VKKYLVNKLKIEASINNSGKIYNLSQITILKEKHYSIVPINLDGDAPKKFIKAYFYESGGEIFKSKFNTWRAFIAKSAEKWYPHESVIEYLLNRVGQILGLRMNSIKLVKVNNQILFLSEYFLNATEELIHGAQVCGEYLEDDTFAKQIADDKKIARELFTIEFILKAIESVFNENHQMIQIDLIKMIVFDAVIGNNDRHFYNWGIIKDIKTDNSLPIFSPIYDTARGLFWNWSDEQIKIQIANLRSNGKKVVNYIKDASPRISIDGNPEINHFDLIKHIWTKYPEFKGTIKSLITFENEENVINLYISEFKIFFLEERNTLVLITIKERFKILRNIIVDD